jgi:hypothetical protein
MRNYPFGPANTTTAQEWMRSGTCHSRQAYLIDKPFLKATTNGPGDQSETPPTPQRGQIIPCSRSQALVLLLTSDRPACHVGDPICAAT